MSSTAFSRYATAALFVFPSSVAAGSDALPISEGAYVQSKIECEELRRSELDFIELEVTEQGRAYGMPEVACVVASVNQLRPNRFAVASDCREIDQYWQHSFMLDVLSKGAIRMDGRELVFCDPSNSFPLDASTVPLPSFKARDDNGPIPQLIESWHEANETCRGGFGDDPKTEEGCSQRELIGDQLSSAGWCFGKQGQSHYEHQWHACAKGSVKN